MCDLEIRALDATDVRIAREMTNRFPDFHARYVVERLPSFFDIARILDPDLTFFRRQRMVTGAFAAGEMIGTAAIERVTDTAPEQALDVEKKLRAAHSQHEVNVYDTLQQSLGKTLIGAPPGSLLIHSLAVLPDYRRQGVAGALIRFMIDDLTQTERATLYIEFARLNWLRQFGVSLGFSTVRQSFSISERLEYGCWGSLLMKYQADEGHP